MPAPSGVSMGRASDQSEPVARRTSCSVGCTLLLESYLAVHMYARKQAPNVHCSMVGSPLLPRNSEIQGRSAGQQGSLSKSSKEAEP